MLQVRRDSGAWGDTDGLVPIDFWYGSTSDLEGLPENQPGEHPDQSRRRDRTIDAIRSEGRSYGSPWRGLFEDVDSPQVGCAGCSGVERAPETP
jgi:hypothetical protein